MSQPAARQRKPASAGSDKESSKDQGVPVDLHIPDNYVQHTLKTTPALPPVTYQTFFQNINWISTIALTATPAIAIYGAFTTSLSLKTFLFAVFWYFVTGLGITAGYHRLWAHRSYNASKPLQYALALAGAGAVQGSIKWWSRGHRAHHRYTDTDLDPYGAHHGLFWSHIGWMIVKPRRKPGVADVTDLNNNPIVRWQHKYYVWLLLLVAFVLPTVIPGLLWGDWRGGYFYAGAARLVFVHHVSRPPTPSPLALSEN